MLGRAMAKRPASRMVEMMARRDYEEKYTKPELRERLKEEIKASDKGGRAGQWSARKSQRLVQEYEKQGGGYKEGENKQERRSLENWQSGQWQTQEGSAHADRGSMKRYLPKEAWERLSAKEREEAEQWKRRADEQGEQHASWPPAVRRVMQELRDESTSKSDLYERAQELDIEGRSSMSKDELQAAIERAESGDGEPSKQDLYERAQDLGIEGRSQMDKAQLEDAVRKAEQHR